MYVVPFAVCPVVSVNPFPHLNYFISFHKLMCNHLSLDVSSGPGSTTDQSQGESDDEGLSPTEEQVGQGLLEKSWLYGAMNLEMSRSLSSVES